MVQIEAVNGEEQRVACPYRPTVPRLTRPRQHPNCAPDRQRRQAPANMAASRFRFASLPLRPDGSVDSWPGTLSCSPIVFFGTILCG